MPSTMQIDQMCIGRMCGFTEWCADWSLFLVNMPSTVQIDQMSDGHMCIGRMCGFIKGGTHGCTKKCTLFGVNTQFCQSGLVRLILNKFGLQAIQWNSGPLITPATKTVQLIFVTRKSVKFLRHVVAFKSAVELLYKIWPVSHSLRKVVGSYPYGHFLVTFLLCICLQ